MNAVAAEFLGTFGLVLVGCGAIALGGVAPVGVAITFGLIVAAMIAAFGRFSGAHFNPAVSIGLAIHGRVSWTTAGAYGLAQVGGALAAAVAIQVVAGDVSPAVTAPGAGIVPAVMLEASFTGILLLTILVVTSRGPALRRLAPIAIGGAVLLGALVAGPGSGGSLNPARSIGPAVVAQRLEDLWIYLVGPVLGAVVVAVAARRSRSWRASVSSAPPAIVPGPARPTAPPGS